MDVAYISASGQIEVYYHNCDTGGTVWTDQGYQRVEMPPEHAHAARTHGRDGKLALDAEGRAVQRMRSFTHFMPGEVQGCVGCHADRNNATPLSKEQLAIRTAAQPLIEPQWGVKGFSYSEIVQPVLDRHCTSCHNEREQPGGVDLSGDRTDFFNVSYDVLARTGTLGAWNWQRHDTTSGPAGDELRGKSPWVSWIWTINGAGHNILQVTPRTWGSPVSRLAKLVETGHPDADGKARVDLPWDDRQRIYRWIDLNVPYYGTSSSNHKQRMGSRRMYPSGLDRMLADVCAKRCAECHQQVPRTFYTRMLKPENNRFLLAPLAKSAGGTQQCGRAVFASTDDPDYQRILQTFEALQKLLKLRPRADMPGFQPECDVTTGLDDGTPGPLLRLHTPNALRSIARLFGTAVLGFSWPSNSSEM